MVKNEIGGLVENAEKYKSIFYLGKLVINKSYFKSLLK